MPAPRRPATKQEILDSFEILTCSDQEGILESLTSIHRILKRERSRNFADPKDNAALLLAMPEEHEA